MKRDKSIFRIVLEAVLGFYAALAVLALILLVIGFIIDKVL